MQTILIFSTLYDTSAHEFPVCAGIYVNFVGLYTDSWKTPSSIHILFMQTIIIFSTLYDTSAHEFPVRAGIYVYLVGLYTDSWKTPSSIHILFMQTILIFPLSMTAQPVHFIFVQGYMSIW